MSDTLIIAGSVVGGIAVLALSYFVYNHKETAHQDFANAFTHTLAGALTLGFAGSKSRSRSRSKSKSRRRNKIRIPKPL